MQTDYVRKYMNKYESINIHLAMSITPKNEILLNLSILFKSKVRENKYKNINFMTKLSDMFMPLMTLAEFPN